MQQNEFNKKVFDILFLLISNHVNYSKSLADALGELWEKIDDIENSKGETI